MQNQTRIEKIEEEEKKKDKKEEKKKRRRNMRAVGKATI